ncbi:MAG: DUF177 domain-containing protein [Armatimonadetes bacterium]|nr:DUF177 domain-containing protein [Armatimonadota bacterium]
MKVDIAEIRQGGAGAKSDFDYQGPLDLVDLRFLGPVQLHLRLSNAGSRLLMQGELEGKVRVTCDRCAEDFEETLTVEIDEEYLPSASPEAAGHEDDPWTDINVYQPEDTTVDVTEVLRQNTLAALPIQALCSEACQGLCASCGENLNKRQCSCERSSIDPRWQPLLKHMQQTEPSSN